MTEATWGDHAMTPTIDWRMSAALENVHRGDIELAEVTNLRSAVQAWQQLDLDHRSKATLTPEFAIQIDGVSTASFNGAAIGTLVERLSIDDAEKSAYPVAD
ncbi:MULTISPECIES: hypothetical protein [Sphingosinicellaceae]|uniref:hypothetical protein n=1 Tax=Sphingosinicellaceae TaxID=2820280 RepID=UPI001C1E0647|nr:MULTISPECIES: hypothetical protein [Polymorphobacter]QYE35604.1 hypothetical protein KZX46_06415 [Polymorphobacter sp. PAMC 29334]UAJ11029.1 hypothetical protein KTC28_04765 [Polymorphobacter megasporae]